MSRNTALSPNTALSEAESMSLRERALDAALALHKHIFSPALHAIAGAQGACRFQPTCSEYAAIALREHGILRGSLMATGRLLRCHPLPLCCCRGSCEGSRERRAVALEVRR